jgi:hypothetical protein
MLPDRPSPGSFQGLSFLLSEIAELLGAELRARRDAGGGRGVSSGEQRAKAGRRSDIR